jgi:hypothetical protein
MSHGAFGKGFAAGIPDAESSRQDVKNKDLTPQSETGEFSVESTRVVEKESESLFQNPFFGLLKFPENIDLAVTIFPASKKYPTVSEGQVAIGHKRTFAPAC